MGNHFTILRKRVYCLPAGVFNEPTLDLVKVLGKLLDENNRIQIPGWYDPVRHDTLSAALERLDALHPPEFTLQEYKETLDIPELNDKASLHPSKLSFFDIPVETNSRATPPPPPPSLRGFKVPGCCSFKA